MHTLKQIKEMFLSLELVERLYIDSNVKKHCSLKRIEHGIQKKIRETYFFFWGDVFKFQAYHRKEISCV